MPKKPLEEPAIILGSIWELSFIAEGAKMAKIPILQIRISITYGINLKRIEGMLKKYF